MTIFWMASITFCTLSPVLWLLAVWHFFYAAVQVPIV